MSAPLVLLRLRYLARGAGWPALAGLVLLGGAAALQFGPLPAAQEKLAGARAAIVAARAQRNAPVRATVDAASLLAALPGRDALDGTLATIHQAAAAQGLGPSSGEYRLRKEAGGELLRYEIALPLNGAYKPLRAWLGDLAARQPAMSIDELNLHRASADTDQLEGRLRLVLFLRARPAEPGAAPAAALAATPLAEGAAPAPAAPAAPSATLPTPQFATLFGELFAAHSWQPPPPPPPPPPKPTAPPLPFKYAGKLVEEQGIRVFLSQGETTTLVKQGDQLGNYDVERVTPSSIVLIYRPLQEKQTLNFGGSID